MDTLQIIGLVLAVGTGVVTFIWRLSKRLHCIESLKDDVDLLRKELKDSAAEVKSDLDTAAATLKTELKEEILHARTIHEKLEGKIDEIIKILLKQKD